MATLTSDQLKVLSKFVDHDDRDGYYRALESFGDPYGKLAGSVVRQDSVSGQMALKIHA